MMKLRLISRALLGALFFVSVASAESVHIRVDSVASSPGSWVAVPIEIANDVQVASVIVPLRYDPKRLYPDSVSFVSTVASSDHLTVSTHSVDSNIVRVLVLPNLTNPMPVIFDPGGLLATVWFSVSPFADTGFSVIDTAYTSDSIIHRSETLYFYPDELQASDPEGLQIDPKFTPGGVSIRQPK